MIRIVTFYTYDYNNFIIQTNKRIFKLSTHEQVCIPQLSNYQIINIYIQNHDHGYLSGRLKKNLMTKILLTNKSASCIYNDKNSNIIIKPIIFRNGYDNNIHITLSLTYRKVMCLTF